MLNNYKEAIIISHLTFERSIILSINIAVDLQAPLGVELLTLQEASKVQVRSESRIHRMPFHQKKPRKREKKRAMMRWPRLN